MPMTQDEHQHPPPAPSSLAGKSGSAASSPMAPPPPPPPPPPQFELEQVELLTKKKKKDFREILALFHDAKMDLQEKAHAWEALWQTTLVETQEEMKQQQVERKAGKHADDATPVRSGSVASRHGPGSGPEPPKRPRQVRLFCVGWVLEGSDASAWLTSAADLEPSKVSRLNRVQQNRPKGGGSKLMQKLGGGR